MSSALPINLADLLYQRGVESSRVEFKASWNEGPTAVQVLHTIVAFANDLQNVNGGYVVVGVDAPEGVAQLPPAGLSPGKIEAIQRWLRGRCRTIDPEYQPLLSHEVVDGRHLLVIWAPGSDTRPHQVPVALERGSERGYFVRLGSETVQARGGILTQLLQLTAKVPFDDRRAHDVVIEKLRESRVREFLSDVRSGLLEEPDARVIYRRMHLSARVNGTEVPRNIGLLFFSDDPEEWFRGARIEIAQFADDASGDLIEEKVFRGPLHDQLRNAITYLRSFSTQHLRKLSDQPEVKGWVSYPLPAMEEALVNAVYHRSYEATPEPTKVYLYPDRIEIISYPGPVPGIEPEHFREATAVPPVPCRNRRIGELLKELRLAEGRGTGIPKMFREMQRNGSPAPVFDFDEQRTYFRVTLPAHPEYVAISALRDAAHLRAVGDHAGALQRLRQALQDQPGSETVAAALISELGRQGLVDEATAVHRAFFEGEHGTQGVRVLLAMSDVLLDDRRQDQAQAMLDRLPTLMSAQDAFEAAILERRAGRQSRAHHLFKSSGDAIFADVRALHEFAQTKMKLAAGRYRRNHDRHQRAARRRLLMEARTMLERVIQMEAPVTRHAWAWFDLGRVLHWLRAPNREVRNAFEQAHRLLPSEERFRKELDAL